MTHNLSHKSSKNFEISKVLDVFKANIYMILIIIGMYHLGISDKYNLIINISTFFNFSESQCEGTKADENTH